MNNDYVIYTDASADVALDVSANSDINFINMPCEADGRIYDCTGVDDDEKVNGFYRDIRKGSLPKTTQITPFRYEEVFEAHLASGKSVIYSCLSSGLSSSYESAKLAAKNLNDKYTDVKVYAIDSIGATAAMSLIAERMLANREKGMSVEENAADIEVFKHKLYTTCYVEDLHHLKRGGRISAVKAALGTMLNLKPIIIITPDGKIANTTNCRGTRKAIMYLCDKYKELADMTSDSPVYVCDADNVEMAEFMVEELKSINPDIVIRRSKLSPIIGTHLGPESVLISFVKK